MVVSDITNQKVIQTLPIGEQVDGVVFDPALKLAFSSNGEGTVTVVKEESSNQYTALQNIPTQKGARTIALDPHIHHLFLPTAEYGPAPAPTADDPNPRPTIKPGTFVILELGE